MPQSADGAVLLISARTLEMVEQKKEHGIVANDKRVYLKVKIKSLAAESRIIRQMERRYRKQTELRDGLTFHRRQVVRKEARATQLAYAFIRGKSFAQTEPCAKREPDWQSVRGMVKRYGLTRYVQELEAWIATADAHRARVHLPAEAAVLDPE